MKSLAIANIEATSATQVRTKIHKDIVDAYQHDLENGAIMPPVIVFAENESERYILADGFHRLLAHVEAELDDILVDVHEGGMHEALEYALGANRAHGLRRTNADKINAVTMALKDPEFSQRTQQEIADLCGVSRETVNRTSMRATIAPDDVTKSQPRPANGEDHRPTLQPPTQNEVERGELRSAMSLIKAFPYPGEKAAYLELDKDDVADLEYVSSWCAHAVLACRSQPPETTDD